MFMERINSIRTSEMMASEKDCFTLRIGNKNIATTERSKCGRLTFNVVNHTTGMENGAGGGIRTHTDVKPGGF